MASVDDPGAGRPREWFEALLESSSDMITVLDSEGTIRYQSPAMRDVLGYPRDTFVGETAFEYIHDADRGRVEDAFGELLEGESGDTVEVQFRFRSADDEWVWLESVAKDQLDSVVGGYVVTSRAIDERRAKDRQLAHFETLLELMPDTVVVTDTEGYHAEIHGFEGWSGYEPDEILGEHVSKTTPEEDLEKGAQVVADLIRHDEKDKATYETHVETKDGDLIPFENHITLLPPDDDGMIPGSMSVLRDISDRKERERQRQQAETVFQNVEDGVFLLDVGDDGEVRIRRVNTAFESLTDLSNEAVVDQRPEALVDSAAWATVETNLRACIDRQEPREFEVEVEGDNEDTEYWHVRLAPVVVDGEVVNVVGTLRNITARKERERRLEQAETVFQNVQDAVFLVEITEDDRCEIRRINDSYEAVTGLSTDEMHGRTPREILGDEVGTPIEARFRECAERREPMAYEEELDVPDLPTYWHTRLAPVIVDDEVVGIVGATRDITERKEREAELRLKNRAMDEAPLGITIADATRPGRPIIYANDGFEALTGYDEVDIQGRNLATLRGPETDADRFERLVSAAERAETATAEVLLSRMDGTPVWSRLSVAPVCDEAGEPTHVVAFQQNVTERKEYETEIERRFDEFGELLAEELGEPLSTARSRLAVALEDLQHPDVEVAATSLERTEHLLEDLAEVHSFTVPSRDVSEATLLGTREDD